MKARYLILFIVLFTTVLFLPHAKKSYNMHDALAAKKKSKVLLIPRDDHSIDFMITEELGVMRTMLEDAGFKVDVATVTGEPYEGVEITINADVTLSDVDISDYVGIIMPCMVGGMYAPEYPEAVQLVKEAVAQGMPVAAQCSSVVTLEKAGVLEGIQFAGPSTVAPAGDEKYMGYGVVQDGNIITSGRCPFTAKKTGKPDGTPELTKLFIEAIKEYSQ
jgi:putative intracellular protease/amidase